MAEAALGAEGWCPLVGGPEALAPRIQVGWPGVHVGTAPHYRPTPDMMLVAFHPCLLAPSLMELGVQSSGVFPVQPVGLREGLRNLRTGLVS